MERYLKDSLKTEYWIIIILEIREGTGKYNYENGDKYDGEWKENKKQGIGKMVYGDGKNGQYYGTN